MFFEPQEAKVTTHEPVIFQMRKVRLRSNDLFSDRYQTSEEAGPYGGIDDNGKIS